MPRAPDVAPAFGAIFFARADVDILADVDRAARRQVVGVEAGGGNRRPQHVGLLPLLWEKEVSGRGEEKGRRMG
jgi:hypothetical protein